eukprot:m51a1_g10664 hypothetical protein (306) ;mRNA; r:5671-6588
MRNEGVLVMLFSQTSVFSFPDVWRLRRVCHAWRNAIESPSVLSSHAARRERIAELHCPELTPETFAGFLLVDSIADVALGAEEREFCTPGLWQSVRMTHVLDMLRRLSLTIASFCCSLLGPIAVIETPGSFEHCQDDVRPAKAALAALAIASAAADLAVMQHNPQAAPFSIVIAPIDSVNECIECLEGSYLVVPPGITLSQARRALERAIKVFARVHELETEKGLKGAELVTVVTGVRPRGQTSKWYYYPLEQHLWVGMLLFSGNIAELAGQYVQCNRKKIGVDPQKKCVLVPWNIFESRYGNMK